MSKKDPWKLFCDNQSAIKLVKNLILHAKMKHIEFHHHYIHETIERKDVKVVYVLSQE
jgi:hypothetical protein